MTEFIAIEDCTYSSESKIIACLKDEKMMRKREQLSRLDCHANFRCSEANKRSRIIRSAGFPDLVHEAIDESAVTEHD